GKLEEAADAFERSLDERRDLGDERPDLIVPTLSQLGFVYQRLERPDEAFEKLNEALDERRTQGHEHQVAIALNNLGVAHRDGGQPEKAIEFYEQALGKLATVKAPAGEATILANLARARLELEAPRKAADLFKQATARFHAAGDPEGEASAHYGWAWALRDLGELEGALGHLDTALRLVENLRTTSPSQDLRISFFATKQHYFDMKIAILMQQLAARTEAAPPS
ncbi:MAG: tetratricopeptide repeat protein, partial [bacterium]|nr:tetratricopeptide repeat protein [bacterium]